MLVQAEQSGYYGTSKIAYVFNMSPWDTNKLHALSFTKNRCSATEPEATMTIVGGLGSFFTGPMTIVAWSEPGYVPATIMGAVGTAGLIGMTVPLIARKLRVPRHKRALAIAEDRRNAVLLLQSNPAKTLSTDAYSMTALLKTPIGETLRKMLTSDAAKSKDDIIAQMSADRTSDSLFMRFKPVLDEYFRSTAEMDVELETARNKDETSRPIQEITKNEQEIDEFAAEVADELANIAKIYEEEVNTQSKTSMEMASDNLRMARQAFRAQRGNYMPEH